MTSTIHGLGHESARGSDQELHHLQEQQEHGPVPWSLKPTVLQETEVGDVEETHELSLSPVSLFCSQAHPKTGSPTTEQTWHRPQTWARGVPTDGKHFQPRLLSTGLLPISSLVLKCIIIWSTVCSGICYS